MKPYTALLALLLGGCTLGLQQAERNWQQTNLDTYDYEVSVRGRAAELEYALVHVETGVAEVVETNTDLDPLLLSGMDGVLEWVRMNESSGLFSGPDFSSQGVPLGVLVEPSGAEPYFVTVELLEVP